MNGPRCQIDDCSMESSVTVNLCPMHMFEVVHPYTAIEAEAAAGSGALTDEIAQMLECKRHGVVPPQRAASFCKACALLAIYQRDES